MKKVLASFMVAGCALAANAVVFPTGPHAAANLIPFGDNQTVTMHQVFRGDLFGSTPVVIAAVGFAPSAAVTGYMMDVTLNMGYTNRIPGLASGAGGLSVPVAGGGGGPNSLGAMSLFYSNPAHVVNVVTPGNNNFNEFVLPGVFVYDPSLGNLLVEIVANVPNNSIDMAVSRAAGSSESSRSYVGNRFSGESPTTATRMDFTYAPVPEPASMIALGLGAAALIRRRRK